MATMQSWRQPCDQYTQIHSLQSPPSCLRVEAGATQEDVLTEEQGEEAESPYFKNI